MYIRLSTGHKVTIDDGDYEWLSKYHWSLHGAKYKYARTTKKRQSFDMHRMIMDAKSGQMVDHINGDTLDNRRANLRIATRKQNSANHDIAVNNHSGVTGVSWNKKGNTWIVYLGRQYLGQYTKFEDAVNVRKRAETKYFGEFARKRG
jgi:hypothetical protein